MAKTARMKVELKTSDEFVRLIDITQDAVNTLWKAVGQLQRQIDELKETRHTHESAPLGHDDGTTEEEADWIKSLMETGSTMRQPRRFQYPVTG